jgi:transposase
MKARIQAGAQLDALIVTAPEPVRAPLRKLTSRQRIRVCAASRPGLVSDPASAVKTALRGLARRWQALQGEIDDLDTQLLPLVTDVAPGLLSLPGAGVETTGQLLDRQASSALWRIALVRMGCHQPTKDYVARRTAEGKTKTEIMRCLKRYIAREVFPHLLMASPSPAHPAEMHPALPPRAA